jgi:hypothetical protein
MFGEVDVIETINNMVSNIDKVVKQFVQKLLKLNTENELTAEEFQQEYDYLEYQIMYEKSKKIKIQNLDIFELKKDLLSFIQFTIDKEVKAHAIEYQVYNNLFAGTIDLICEMNFNGKRVNAIVDYKSGRNGFYDSHRVQLHAYKSLLKECQNLDVDMVFNFSPKDWRLTETIKPTYNLENQSDAVWSEKWNLYSELFRLDLHQQKETTIKNITLNNIITNDFNNLVTIEEYEMSK